MKKHLRPSDGPVDGSAALLYPAIVVFVLLFAALVFDTFLTLSHERQLAHHVEGLGRQMLTHFDRDRYRATGDIVVEPVVAHTLMADANDTRHVRDLFAKLDCDLALNTNQVEVRCDARVKQGVFGPRAIQQITVSRRLIATPTCRGYAAFDTADG